MSTRRAVGRPLVQCLQQAQVGPALVRFFTVSSSCREETTTTTTTTPPSEEPINPLDLDPNTALGRWAESHLAKLGTPPIGSRRRRSALRSSQNIPFEQLPYQCFQEARKILAADREEKLQAIAVETAKIQRLESVDPNELKGGERMRQMKLASLRKYLERLKILADINDPAVKRRFEDGLGMFARAPRELFQLWLLSHTMILIPEQAT